MRKTLKFLHTLASCGIVGALAGYAVLLVAGPQETVAEYAATRQSIQTLCSHLLLPSLGVALASGLFAMAVHHPFHELRWVWIKALLGLSMFEGTLLVIGSKANMAAALSARIAEGRDEAAALEAAIASEWQALGLILALSILNIVLGVWRPSLKFRRREQAVPGR